MSEIKLQTTESSNFDDIMLDVDQNSNALWNSSNADSSLDDNVEFAVVDQNPNALGNVNAWHNEGSWSTQNIDPRCPTILCCAREFPTVEDLFPCGCF